MRTGNTCFEGMIYLTEVKIRVDVKVGHEMEKFHRGHVCLQKHKRIEHKRPSKTRITLIWVYVIPANIIEHINTKDALVSLCV